jgi:hypothetical protein
MDTFSIYKDKYHLFTPFDMFRLSSDTLGLYIEDFYLSFEDYTERSKFLSPVTSSFKKLVSFPASLLKGLS